MWNKSLLTKDEQFIKRYFNLVQSHPYYSNMRTQSRTIFTSHVLKYRRQIKEVNNISHMSCSKWKSIACPICCNQWEFSDLLIGKHAMFLNCFWCVVLKNNFKYFSKVTIKYNICSPIFKNSEQLKELNIFSQILNTNINACGIYWYK